MIIDDNKKNSDSVIDFSMPVGHGTNSTCHVVYYVHGS